jgi:hypothetical protein
MGSFGFEWLCWSGGVLVGRIGFGAGDAAEALEQAEQGVFDWRRVGRGCSRRRSWWVLGFIVCLHIPEGAARLVSGARSARRQNRDSGRWRREKILNFWIFPILGGARFGAIARSARDVG